MMTKKTGMAICGRARNVGKTIERICNTIGRDESIEFGITGFCATGILVESFQKRYDVKIYNNMK
jgi:hypothetical protein